MPVASDISNELRTMVREVLRDAMAARAQPGAAAVETVRIASDLDLATFVSRVIEPATLEKIKSGKLRFTLDGTIGSLPCGALSGVVTEQMVGRLDPGATLVLAPDAVLTPLARDKARKLAITIERRR